MFRLSYSGFVIQNGRRKLFWNQAQMNREESVYCQGWRGETKERGRRVRGWGGHLASRSMRKTHGSLKGKTGFLGRPRISVIRRRTGATLLQKKWPFGKTSLKVKNDGEWRGEGERCWCFSRAFQPIVVRELEQARTATATRGTRKRLFPYFWRYCNFAYSYLTSNFFRFRQSSIASSSLTTEESLWLILKMMPTSWQQPKNEVIEVASEVRRPRDRVNSHIHVRPLVFCN